jgi:serine/threonine protein kinase
MSPELFNYKPYSYKSDIWSLGCVLYEICNLKHAFNAQTINALAIKIMKGNFASVSSVYSKEIRDLIHSMLSIDLKNRPNIKIISNNPIVQKAVSRYLIKIVKESNDGDFNDSFVDGLKIQVIKFGISSIIQSDSDCDDKVRNFLLGNRKESLKMEELKYLKLTKEQELRNELFKKQKLENEIKNLKEIQSKIDSVQNESELESKYPKLNNSSTIKNPRIQLDSASFQQSENIQSECNDFISNDPDEYDDFDFVEDLDDNNELPKEVIHSKIDQVQKQLLKNTVVIEEIQNQIEKMGEKIDKKPSEPTPDNFDDSFEDSREIEEFIPNYPSKTKEPEVLDFDSCKIVPLFQERIAFAQSLAYKQSKRRSRR